METSQSLKGGSLNDQLAIERTVMSNDRTLLSFIRTALYFAVAGLTLTQFFSVRYGFLFQGIFFLLALCTLAAGFYKYRRQLRRIRQSRNHINSFGFDAGAEEEQPLQRGMR